MQNGLQIARIGSDFLIAFQEKGQGTGLACL